MNQIGFKGYAQSLGFDPIKAPDLASKELEQGKNEIRNMERKSESDLRVRQAQADSMATAFRQEADNRNENQNFETQWRRGYQEAINQNNRLKTANANQEVENVSNNFAALGALSQTAAKLATDYKAKKDEETDTWGKLFVEQNGITPEMIATRDKGEDYLSQGETAINGIANQAPNAEVRKQIKDLSGKKLYSVVKHIAIAGGQQYSIWLQENMDREVPVGDKKISLRQAQMGDPATYAATRNSLKLEYYKRFNGIDNAVLDKYLFEDVRKVELQDNAQYKAQRGKVLELEEKAENTTTLMDGIRSVDGGQAFLTWIQEQAGGDKAAIRGYRIEGLGLFTAQAKSGNFTSADYNKLKDTPVSLGGAKPKPFGELYKDDMVELTKAVKGYNRELAQEADEAQQTIAKEFETKFYENKAQLGRNYNKEELRQLGTLWDTQIKGPRPGWLKSEESNESVSSELADEQLQYLENYNMLTTTELYKGIYNNDTIAKWKDRAGKNGAIAGASDDTKKNTKGQIEAALKKTLRTIDRGSNQTPSFYEAREQATRDFNARVKSLFSSGTITADQAYSQAATEISNEIAKGVSGDGKYALKGKIVNGKFQPIYGDEADFVLASSSGTTAAQLKRSANVQNRVRANPESLKSIKYLSEPEIKQVQAFAKSGSGSLPPILQAIASNLKNVSIFDVADAQMIAYGQAPISRPSTAKLYDEISPEVRSMLTWRPSRARTVQALERSGQPYAPLLDLIASNESQSTDPGNKGYDAFNRKGAGGTYPRSNSLNGTKISQLTVGEVMAEQSAGRLYAVGRYQYIPSTLASRVDKGIIRTSDLFNAQTQDKLAISSIKNKASRFFSGTATAEQVIPGLGNEWHGLQLISAKRQKEVLEQTKLNLQNFNVDTSDWKPGIVYRVSGIGPKQVNGKTVVRRDTYGPHIDAKLSDNAYFDRKYLDKYVDVSIKGKRVPVSAGPTVDGGEFGASRRYGTHYGWDYAFPDGSPVYLKNGAYVVRKQKTDWGTKLTIALPDGRTVNFLHGDA